ncbi:MAG: GFA family protein [Paracoccaceae bacterium]
MQCRKFSGHYTASFDAEEAALTWQAQSLAEHLMPHGGRQAFCPGCGSRLFFRSPDGSFSIEAGAIDGPTGLRLDSHIFVSEKGDYYDITDGLPQYERRD